MTDLEEHARAALAQARMAEQEGNHPYGSVITGPRGTIAARNRVETTADCTAHAELVAVREATARWGLDLSGATLITTFEPCAMCAGAIVNSGLRDLVIAVRSAPGIEAPGQYSVERLLDLLGLRDEFTLTRGVLEEEITAYYAGLAT
ncbi:nucleoside deaminase [Microbacterium hydrocarbonoxydans]|uniref:nucleoside deaminase n=1 Tax=Microbacterium hydrocarbonoxydans TaxID=273678 RepID=UPI0007BB7103|nr:nucleoside deaminase [Microbacterium hydrocarbonoxydans]GAT72460.1 CMP/dCMP deaminase zinc-binding protein [Microbacterium sp. HM58-2]